MIYDDNYGFYHNTDEPEVMEFYRETQRNSVMKRCKRCDRMVKLRRDYAICNNCCEQEERGFQY